MSDVFISYSRKDRNLAEQLAKDLIQQNISIWYDTSIIAGELFANVILANLNNAKAVVVIWSPNSIHSEWVRSEASRARRRNSIVPVQTDSVTEDDIPPPFDQLHTINFGSKEQLREAIKLKLSNQKLEQMPPRTAPISSAQQLFPSPIVYCSLAVNVIVSITAMLHMASEVVPPRSFLNRWVELYQQYYHEPIRRAIDNTWPTDWWKIPDWGFDLFLIWSFFFLSLRICAQYNNFDLRMAIKTPTRLPTSGTISRFASRLAEPFLVLWNALIQIRLVAHLFWFILGPIALFLMFIGSYWYMLLARQVSSPTKTTPLPGFQSWISGVGLSELDEDLAYTRGFIIANFKVLTIMILSFAAVLVSSYDLSRL